MSSLCSQARHGRSRTLVPHPSPCFPPRCPSPVTLLLAPSSHTVQPSILDRARVRDLHASPCYSRQGKDIENMDPRGSRKQEFDLTCAGIDSVQGSLMIKGS
ncbi:hypothetical protein FOFC_11221 [Fusarium oxysporum]|nr:hypothetical protein FOFC_11221 [Fusarium oxysporum]